MHVHVNEGIGGTYAFRSQAPESVLLIFFHYFSFPATYENKLISHILNILYRKRISRSRFTMKIWQINKRYLDDFDIIDQGHIMGNVSEFCFYLGYHWTSFNIDFNFDYNDGIQAGNKNCLINWPRKWKWRLTSSITNDPFLQTSIEIKTM